MPKSRSILFSAFVLLLGIETSNANVIVESRDEQPQNSALTNLNENLELAAKGGDLYSPKRFGSPFCFAIKLTSSSASRGLEM